MQDIGGPISIGVPFAVIWAYYGKWLNQQIAFDEDPPRRAGKQRLYSYILSFLGLAATFFAVASLFSVVIDQANCKSLLKQRWICFAAIQGIGISCCGASTLVVDVASHAGRGIQRRCCWRPCAAFGDPQNIFISGAVCFCHRRNGFGREFNLSHSSMPRLAETLVTLQHPSSILCRY